MQLSLIQPATQARARRMSKATPLVDETKLGAIIHLAGGLATAGGLAAVFLRLHPDRADVAAAYLAALDQMRQVFNEVQA